jgi:putative peptidoglycan lipid II flippase
MRFRFGLSFTHPAVRKVIKLLIPGFFGAGISQINFSLSRVFASSLEEGSVSSLYYASRVQELTLGLFSIALSIALLPTFSEQAAGRDIKGIKKTLDSSLKLIFLVTFPAMIGLFILREPIFQVLFQRGAFNTQSTVLSASCLLFLCFGLPFISGVKIIAPVFYSLKDTKTPVIVAFFVMLLYISLSFLLMKPLGVGGIALALSLSSVFNFIFLFIMLEKKIGKLEKKSLMLSFFKSALLAVGMGGAVWLFIGQFEFAGLILVKKIGILSAAMGAGLLIYVLLNLLFNHEDLRSLKVVFSRKDILKE